jgi:phosphatidylserine decarboxylase
LVIVSPVEADTLIQAKGISYGARELVFGRSTMNEDPFQAAWYGTVYLAPHNYHRVHTPADGVLVSVRHIPGDLWPVNTLATSRVPALFCANARLVFEICPKSGGRVFAVMVGALNVGRMSATACPGRFTNDGTLEDRFCRLDPPVSLRIGDELGVFHLGSTVVLVLDEVAAQAFAMTAVADSRVIRVGELIAAPR